ncbi:helix-turn-helix transcriptional regulator [Kitasatospora nipponensis]
MSDERQPRTSWTFLTHHARVLVMISHNAEVRLRELAMMCGLTERAVQAIVTDLESAGYVVRSKHGRRNHYRVVRGTFFRHPAEAHHEIAGFLDLFADLPPGADPHRDPRSGHVGQYAEQHPEPQDGEPR